jgi:hypothetical protein
MRSLRIVILLAVVLMGCDRVNRQPFQPRSYNPSPGDPDSIAWSMEGWYEGGHIKVNALAPDTVQAVAVWEGWTKPPPFQAGFNQHLRFRLVFDLALNPDGTVSGALWPDDFHDIPDSLQPLAIALSGTYAVDDSFDAGQAPDSEGYYQTVYEHGPGFSIAVSCSASKIYPGTIFDHLKRTGSAKRSVEDGI